MRTIICFALAVLSLAGRAQTKELTIGDTLPDLALNRLMNYSSPTAKISDFKGKLLVLDFWATWCGPCIQEFPKIDSLQKQFGDRIQILGVTDQDEKTVSAFFDRYQKIQKGQPIPTVTGDTVLRKMFRHTGIPHEVWIDGTGKVVAITYAEELTAKNIESFLKGEALKLPVKIDQNRPILYKEAIFSPSIQYYKRVGDEYFPAPEPVNPNGLLLQSTFTRYQPGLTSRNMQSVNRVVALNSTVENLFSIAFGRFNWEYMYYNRSSWEATNPELYEMRNRAKYGNKEMTMTQRKEWDERNTFCYELIVPAGMDGARKFDIMQKELNEAFGALYGIEAGMEKRKVKVLALTRTSSADKIKSKDTSMQPVMEGGGIYSLKVKNNAIDQVVNLLRSPLQSYPPLINETGYKGKVDVELNGQLDNLGELNKLLAKYDLKLVEKEAVLDMVVIKDKTTKKQRGNEK